MGMVQLLQLCYVFCPCRYAFDCVLAFEQALLGSEVLPAPALPRGSYTWLTQSRLVSVDREILLQLPLQEGPLHWRRRPSEALLLAARRKLVVPVMRAPSLAFLVACFCIVVVQT